jgi:hypothetical protein
MHKTTTICRSVMLKSTLLLFVVFLLSVPAFTQESTQVDLETAKRLLQQERETIFIEALHLSVTQAAVFHPIYVEFNREKRVLDDLLIKLFVQYSENYDKLDHKLMHNFIKKSKEHQRRELRVRKKYYLKLGKAISTELASQFYEVDDFICTNLRLNVLTGLPFTGSIVKEERN